MTDFLVIVKEHEQERAVWKLKKRVVGDLDVGPIIRNAGEVTVNFSVSDRYAPEVTALLNNWFCRDHNHPAPFPMGTLLFWQTL